MTYSRTHRPADRVATLVAVGAIQAAAFYALVAGLSVAFAPVDSPPPISATNSPLPVPPPAEPHHRTRAKDPVIKPLPEPLPSPLPTALASPQPIPTDNVLRDPQPMGSGGAQDDPQLRLQPGPVAPRTARPLGRPGEWVTEADYPTSEIRLDHAGVVAFSLTVSPAGRVTGCEIVRSSGYATLDALTCSLLTRRGRFQPAADDHGQPMGGRYQSAVRWQIPD